MKPSRAVLFSLLLASAVAQADSVWAPGVSQSSGWVDYNKDRGSASGNDDSLMCWAASSSNIITWWQNQQKETAIPKPDYTGSTWDFFRTITASCGGNPRFALGWYVNGSDVGPYWQWDTTNSKQYQTGGFLQSVYCTADNPVFISNSESTSKDPYAQAAALVGALQSGYALTLEVGVPTNTANVPSSHAITLWGLDYTKDESGNITINNAYITDSDDGVTGIVTCTVKYAEGSSIHISPTSGSIKGLAYEVNRADGMNAGGYLDPEKPLEWNAQSGSGDRYVTRDASVTGTANLGNLIFNDSSTVTRTDLTSCISGNGHLTINNGTVVFDGVSRTGTSGDITINAGTILELKNGAKMYSDTEYNSSSKVSVHGTLKVESLEYGKGNLGCLRDNLGALDLYDGARVEISGADTTATIGVTMYGDKARYTIALADNSVFDWRASGNNNIETANGAADNILVLETGENATFSLGKSVSGALSLHKTGAGRLEIQGGINLDSNSEVQVLGGTMHIAETASITTLGSLRVENAKVQGSVNKDGDGARITVASSVTLSNASLRDVQLFAAAASLSVEDVAYASTGPALTSVNSSYIFNDSAPVIGNSGAHEAYITSPVLSGFSTIDGALTLGITMDFMQGVMEKSGGQINYLQLALLADGMAAGQSGFTITLDAATQAMLDASTLVKYGFYDDEDKLLGITSTGQMKELGVVNFCVHGLSELVPEPTSATLSLMALAALSTRRRRC